MRRRRDLATRFDGGGLTAQSGSFFCGPAAHVELLGPMVATGLYLGPGREVGEHDDSGDPVVGFEEPLSMELFSTRPRRIVLLTENQLAPLIAIRAAACGAAVAVVTASPYRWHEMNRRAGEHPFLMLLGPRDVVPDLPRDQPLLVLIDGLPRSQVDVSLPDNPRSEIWLADPNILSQYAALFDEADMVGLGRTRADVINQAIELGRAPARLGTLIETLQHHQVVLRTRNVTRLLDVLPTTAELELLPHGLLPPDQPPQAPYRQGPYDAQGAPQGNFPPGWDGRR